MVQSMKWPARAAAFALFLLTLVSTLTFSTHAAYASDATLVINEDLNNFGYVNVTATAEPSNAFSQYAKSGLYAAYWYRDGDTDTWHKKAAQSVKNVASNFTYSITITSSEMADGRQWKCAVYNVSAARSITAETTPLCQKEFSVSQRSVSVSGNIGIKGSSVDLTAELSSSDTQAVSYTWQRKASGSSTWSTVAICTSSDFHPVLDDEALSATWRCVVTAADGITTGANTTFKLYELTPTLSGTTGCYGASAVVTASLPQGVKISACEWQYQLAGSTDWNTLADQADATVSLPVNDETLAATWRVVVTTDDGVCSGEFTLSYDSFAVDYSDASAGISGYIVYEIASWPTDSVDGIASLKDGSAFSQSADSPILQIGKVAPTIQGATYSFDVLSVSAGAFRNNESLYAIEFTEDLTGVAKNAIGEEAFANCTNLQTVKFGDSSEESTCMIINGIGTSAFINCTQLTSVTFADGLEMTAGIGMRAFKNCSKLKSISIPAITCAQRLPNYYSWFGLTSEMIANAGLSTTDQWYHESGYQEFWHNDSFGIFSGSIEAEVFAGCTELETVDFKAGTSEGLFAYWNALGCGLGNLPNLTNVIYETTQPYYGDPNRSLVLGTFKSLWGQTDEDTGVTGSVPNFYYAVDFYATEAQADAADQLGSTRYARVEYQRSTPTGLIQSGSKSADDYAYADASLYATLSTDGTTPDPKAVAVASGLDTENSTTQWVWKLTDSQSRRAGLTESCQAYLVKADDLSAGRLGTDTADADQMGTLYELCDQNMSRGSIQDSAFDYERYYGKKSTVCPGASIYAFAADQAPRHSLTLEEGKTAWFSIGGTKKSFLSQITLYDGVGNSFDLTDSDQFTVTFEQYDTDTGTLEDVTYAHLVEGPVLVTVTPKEGSGYNTSTCLQEWTLVKPQAVTELLTPTASETATSAQYINADGTQTESFDSKAFSVNVSSADYLSSLLAVSYAGLSRGALSVTSSDDEYGFQIDSQGNTTDFSLKDELNSGGSVSSFAVNCLDDYAYQKEIGNISCDASWGSEVVLVNPAYVTEVATAAASYAYAKQAPILYTEDDGTLSDVTLAALQNFRNVVVIGSTKMVPDSSLTSASGAVVRISGADGDTEANACSLSLAVAKELTSGDSTSNSLENVAIVLGDGEDMVLDVAGALNFSGHRDGVTLAVSSTADAKRVTQYLKDTDDTIVTIRVFGRTVASSNSQGYGDVESSLVDCLAAVQDPDAAVIPGIGSGDTLEIDGVMFQVGSAGALTALEASSTESQTARKWNTAAVEAGSYVYDGSAYALAETYPAADKTLRVPVAVKGLTYNGAEQSGLTGMLPRAAYDVQNGTATAVGSYTAQVTPKEGYTWADGSTETKTVNWAIENKATLGGGSVTLEYSTHEYTGSMLKPAVTVKLRDGSILPDSDYTVDYADNTAVGTATITIKATGVNVDTKYDLTAHFAITAVQKKQDQGSIIIDDDDTEDVDYDTATSKAASKNASTAGASDDDDSSDGANQTDSNIVDGWKMFYAPGESDDSAFVSTTGISGLGTSPLGASGVAVCCLAFCGAVAYSSRARKETDDIIDEVASSEEPPVD